MVVDVLWFFFSSRRRHTRCGRDWSSDVCSSDLVRVPERGVRHMRRWGPLLLGFALVSLNAPALAQDGMTLEQVAKVKTVSRAAISPAGGEVAYVLSVPRLPGVDKDGRAHSELHVVDRLGNSRGFVTGEVGVGAIEWFPDGRDIGFLARREGDSTRGLYRIPLGGGEAKRVARLESDLSGFSLSPDGARAALLAQEPEGKDLKEL